VLERSIAELIEDGFIDRHVRKARRVYRERRDLLASLLKEKLGDAVRFDVPRGGLSLWAEVAPELDAGAWQDRALARDVLVLSGRHFARQSPPNALRVGYGSLDAGELSAAVSLLAGARPRAGSSERRAKKPT
jgi:GntR family transcriptional regulator/MocR family aminotransferase